MRNLTTYRTLVVLLVALALAGCAVPPAAPALPEDQPAQPADAQVPAATPALLTPAEVVTRMAERFSAGDLEGGMAYWADDAVWYALGLPPTGFEMIVGKEALRTEFENEIAAHLTWEVEPKLVVGNVVTSHDTTWLDFTRQIGVAPVGATGQYLVENGKVVEYTWTVDPESLDKLMAALAEMPAEAEAVPEVAPPVPEPVSALTITIADGTCSYDGPAAVQAGKLEVTVEVLDQDKEAYAVTFMTVDPGRDFAALMASTTGMPPSWAQLLHYEEVGPGQSGTWSIDAAKGPLYAICWARPPDHPIGNLGPFEVSE